MEGSQQGERTGRRWLSTAVSIAMVAAAGAITWYGLAPSPAPVAESHEPPATMTAEAPRVVPSGPRSGLPTRIAIPSAGIDFPVDEVGIIRGNDGPRWQTAWRAAGHHMDSALPGNPGNVVLTGHVSVANGDNIPVFANLDQVSVGDLVEVYSGEARYTYRVEAILRVPPESTGVLRGDHTARVTLITCTRDLQDRLVVVGALVG